MPGNNSRVVMTAMRKRPWWHAILGNNAAEAEDQNDLSAIQPTFLWEMIRRACRYRTSQFHNTLMNHVQRNNSLVTKKGLYLSLKAYCQEHSIDILSIVPRTYYLAPGEHSKSMKDDDMEDFLNYCNSVPDKRPEELVWILKPASRTNRGFGIKVVQGLDRVMNIIQRGMSACSSDGKGDTCGEESGEDDDDEENAAPTGTAVSAPTGINGREKEVRAYFFQEAYIRTSCKKYVNANFSDRETHLTNDAVQKHAKSYGQFEEGNKLSLPEWEQVLLEEYPAVSRPGIVMDQIFPEIKRLSKISIASVAQDFAVTDINKSFELFGYDYMIREDLSPVLIEVNTNPCLEFNQPQLRHVITPTSVFGAAIVRLLIPLFLCMSNIDGNRLPIITKNDGVTWLLTALLGFTNGSVANIAMMQGPSLVNEGADASLAGTIMVFCLSSGLLMGSCLSFLLLFIVVGA
eukprot:gene1604-1167_t